MSTTPTRAQIEDAIRAEAEKRNLDPQLLVAQCGVESSFNPFACNVASNCYGLFQLQANTAKYLGVDRGDWRANVRGGVDYMARLNVKYRGDYSKALAAFDWGPGHLDHLLASSADSAKGRWLAMGKPELPAWPGTVNEYPGGWRAFLPDETTEYLVKILGPGA